MIEIGRLESQVFGLAPTHRVIVVVSALSLESAILDLIFSILSRLEKLKMTGFLGYDAPTLVAIKTFSASAFLDDDCRSLSY